MFNFIVMNTMKYIPFPHMPSTLPPSSHHFHSSFFLELQQLRCVFVKCSKKGKKQTLIGDPVELTVELHGKRKSWTITGGEDRKNAIMSWCLCQSFQHILVVM